MTYQRTAPKQMVIDHTQVFDGNEGKGIARQMVSAAVDFARTNGRKIVPICSYARTVLTRTTPPIHVLPPQQGGKAVDGGKSPFSLRFAA